MTDRGGPRLCSRYLCTRVAVTFDPVPLCALHDPGGAVGAELANADTSPTPDDRLLVDWAARALEAGINYGTHDRCGPCAICRAQPRGAAGVTVSGVALAQQPIPDGPAHAYLRTLIICAACIGRMARDLPKVPAEG